MKKTLSLILAVMMLLGCMSVTAFATTDNSTDITLTVAKALTYDMVIPEDVTNLSNFGIYSVGLAKVTNVKNATDKTVISYTAETADFKSEGKTDIPASYYTDAQGAAAFPTTEVEVYKNKADVASIPTMYVGISENAWNAAENGTYTATVTFNFEAKEAAATVTAADALVTGAQHSISFHHVQRSDEVFTATYEKTADGIEVKKIIMGGDDVTSQLAGKFTATVEGSKIIYSSSNIGITIDTSKDTDEVAGNNVFESFSVKPAGAAEFTNITLTNLWKQVGEILATVENFPNSSALDVPPAGAWTAGTGMTCYTVDNSSLIINLPSDAVQIYFYRVAQLSDDGSYIGTYGVSTTFVMDDGKLTAILYPGVTDPFTAPTVN